MSIMMVVFKSLNEENVSFQEHNTSGTLLNISYVIKVGQIVPSVITI